MSVEDLPALNASLNGVATVFLLAGYVLVRQRRIAWHRAAMLAAFAASTAFLVSYLVYHYHVGSRPYPGSGAARALYLTVLATHVVLAAAVPPLAIVTLTRGLGGRFASHRAIARWTLPIWLYVSITGVIVYVMLYVVK